MKQKTHIPLVATLCMALIYTACTTDNDLTRPEALPVEIIATTAAHTRAEVKTTFEQGDKISLKATYTTQSTHSKEANYTLTDAPATTWTPEGEPLMLPDNEPCTIVATYTATDPANLHAGDLTKRSLFADDLRATATTAEGTIVATNGQARTTLAFNHLHALLKPTVTNSAQNPLPPSDIDKINVIIATDDSKTYLTGLDDAKQAQFIAPAGTIQSLTVTLTNGLTYTSEPAEANKSIEAGKSYKLQISVAGGVVSFTLNEDNDFKWNVQDDKVAGYDGEFYIIKSVEDLEEFRRAVYNTQYSKKLKAIQVADITFGANDKDWIPIGYDEDGKNPLTFSGVYNGNGYKINGLRIEGSYPFAGLFGYLEDAVLTGIHLREVDIKNASNANSYYYTGALAGAAFTTSLGKSCISLCSAEGSVKLIDGKGHTGGLIGYANAIHITRCRANCNVNNNSTSQSYSGGLVGYAINSHLVACEATGKVTGTGTNYPYSGGLVGHANGCTIFCCRAKGDADATGDNYVRSGGLVGCNLGTNIYNSYATGNANATSQVSGTPDAGSLIGYINGGTITNCHATGKANDVSNKPVGFGPKDGINTDDSQRKTIIRQDNDQTGIYTTLWQSNYPSYGIEILEKTFKSTDVWTDEDEPKINFDYNGN